jgi:signal transduction histidine kinase/ActR/RegA family two-component response regulator
VAPAGSVLRTLLHLAESVGRAANLDDIYDAALTGLRDALGAERASILLFDPDGVMRFKAWRGISDAYRAAVQGHTPWAPGAAPAPPIVVRSVHADASLTAYLPVFERERIEALAFIPLVAGGRIVGKFMLYYGEPHDFTDDEITTALTIAYHIGFAVERTRTEIEHTRLFAEAQQASRLKDEFLSTLSHEVRTPLTTILGWSSLLRSGAVPEARVPDALATIERNARAQARLIDDVLDVARVTTGKLSLAAEPMRPVHVLAMELEAIRPVLADKGVRLIGDLGPAGDAIIEADPARFRQVAWNLLSNAAKFTRAGGQITVRARVRGAQFEFSVEDSGCGIPPEFLPHVFDRFRQADGSAARAHGGLGLGLSITRDIVHLHGGTIQVSSEGVDRGARFVVRLPLAFTAAHDAIDEEPAAADVETPLRSIRALVVDDDADTLELVRTLLEARGARVTCAGTVGEVFACLAGGQFDVLLADLAMPITDGYSLIRGLRSADAHWRALPAVAVTACARQADAARALDAGFNAFCPKPIDADALVRAVIDVTTQVRGFVGS